MLTGGGVKLTFVSLFYILLERNNKGILKVTINQIQCYNFYVKRT